MFFSPGNKPLYDAITAFINEVNAIEAEDNRLHFVQLHSEEWKQEFEKRK